VKPQIDGLGRLDGLVAEILVARAFGVKEVLRTHIYLPESASTSPHEIEIRSRTLPRCVGLDRLATKSNRGKSREELREGAGWILRFGRGMACRSRSRQGSGWPWWTHEVGVVGDLGVRLHLLHAAQLCAATTAPERQSRLCRRGPARRATREGWRGEERTMQQHGGREEAVAERGGAALRRRVPARKLAPP